MVKSLNKLCLEFVTNAIRYDLKSFIEINSKNSDLENKIIKHAAYLPHSILNKIAFNLEPFYLDLFDDKITSISTDFCWRTQFLRLKRYLSDAYTDEFSLAHIYGCNGFIGLNRIRSNIRASGNSTEIRMDEYKQRFFEIILNLWVSLCLSKGRKNHELIFRLLICSKSSTGFTDEAVHPASSSYEIIYERLRQKWTVNYLKKLNISLFSMNFGFVNCFNSIYRRNFISSQTSSMITNQPVGVLETMKNFENFTSESVINAFNGVLHELKIENRTTNERRLNGRKTNITNKLLAKIIVNNMSNLNKLELMHFKSSETKQIIKEIQFLLNRESALNFKFKNLDTFTLKKLRSIIKTKENPAKIFYMSLLMKYASFFPKLKNLTISGFDIFFEDSTTIDSLSFESSLETISICEGRILLVEKYLNYGLFRFFTELLNRLANSFQNLKRIEFKNITCNNLMNTSKDDSAILMPILSKSFALENLKNIEIVSYNASIHEFSYMLELVKLCKNLIDLRLEDLKFDNANSNENPSLILLDFMEKLSQVNKSIINLSLKNVKFMNAENIDLEKCIRLKNFEVFESLQYLNLSGSFLHLSETNSNKFYQMLFSGSLFPSLKRLMIGYLNLDDKNLVYLLNAMSVGTIDLESIDLRNNKLSLNALWSLADTIAMLRKKDNSKMIFLDLSGNEIKTENECATLRTYLEDYIELFVI